ncbi:secretory phospholipase A2 receptor-like isoform X2 [Aricia agestis]|uniref:secretory phospholipase A2 receptor-like isoform X2 n=1 Tax=Aricia agestis TaxID=91739 RepID=UPI001C202AA5|nr:secretory phospholipase A2 receptor-like isoform X2 [Aricia agestis]
MKFFLLVVIAVFSCAAGQKYFFRSDYNFVPEFSSWLKFHREPLPWHLARRTCEYEGARLITPMSRQNASYLKEVQSGFNVNEMYTGAHSTYGLGEFYTVDGIPYMGISQHMWRRDGLSYSHEDRCVIIDNKGLLASVRCDEGYPFMCSKRFVHLTVTECGTTDPAYTLDKSTGSCYKLHREHEDWNTAVTVCTAEGGYLAIPSDASEAQLLADMATEDETIIGYMNWEGTRISDKWHTLHGDDITSTGWAERDPFDIVSACGAIKKNLPC